MQSQEQSTDLNTPGVTAIDNTILSASEPDVTTSQIIYRVEGLPTGAHGSMGSLQIDRTGGGTWSTLNMYDSFTQADVNAGHVRFLQNGSENLVARFKVSVSDGSTRRRHSRSRCAPCRSTTSRRSRSTRCRRARKTTTAPCRWRSIRRWSRSTTSTGTGDRKGSEVNTGDDPSGYSLTNTLTFKIVAGPAHGKLQVLDGGTWTDLTVGNFYSYDYITGANAKGLRYVNDGNEPSAYNYKDSFTIQADDNTNAATGSARSAPSTCR